MSCIKFVSWPAAMCLAAIIAGGASADPWADHLVSYVEGAGVQGPNTPTDFVTGASFNDPLTALGSPTRITSPDSFGSAVTPLNAPFRANEIVSIGRGGELVVRFDEPVTNHAANPFGIDLLIFGNAFFAGFSFPFDPADTAAGVAAEGGRIEVSADGVNFVLVPGAVADGLYPTNGYADLADPFVSSPGAVPANFTLPVDPAFDPIGKTYAQILAGYNGSGGGFGVDLATVGLTSISYVRISNPLDAQFVPEIDAFADVAALPEPAASTAFLACAVLFAWQTRKRRYGRA